MIILRKKKVGVVGVERGVSEEKRGVVDVLVVRVVAIHIVECVGSLLHSM